jgi:hypothetical protein
MEKPIKLFNWKKGIVIITVGMGGVLYRTYQLFQQKGVAAITVTILCSVVAFVGWWANR